MAAGTVPAPRNRTAASRRRPFRHGVKYEINKDCAGHEKQREVEPCVPVDAWERAVEPRKRLPQHDVGKNQHGVGLPVRAGRDEVHRVVVVGLVLAPKQQECERHYCEGDYPRQRPRRQGVEFIPYRFHLSHFHGCSHRMNTAMPAMISAFPSTFFQLSGSFRKTRLSTSTKM